MILKIGEILGFETDTVWGLGCLPNDSKAVDKIYEIKGRDRTKPLILMSNNLESLMSYVLYVPDYAKTLIDKYFPGALTLIFEKSSKFKIHTFQQQYYSKQELDFLNKLAEKLKEMKFHSVPTAGTVHVTALRMLLSIQ